MLLPAVATRIKPAQETARLNYKPLKAAKKEKKELDEDELAHQAKLKADAKARKDMQDAAKGKKGPLNTGQQGIKKSGKK